MATKKNNRNDVLMAAALAAIKLIQEPKVQDQIAQAGGAVAGAMKKKRASKREQAKADKEQGPKRKKKVAGTFGNQKLVRRVEKLSENVNLLRGSVGPEAAQALGEVDRVVERLQVAVTMAANLPIGKRQKAHWEIDSVLDELERAVFASAME